MVNGVRGHAYYAIAILCLCSSKRQERQAESLMQNVRSFRIDGALSICGYRIINYPNLERGVSLHVY